MIHRGRKVMLLDKGSQHIGSQLFTLLLITIDSLKCIELISEYFLGGGHVSGTVLHLVERYYLEALLFLSNVHQPRMTAA